MADYRFADGGGREMKGELIESFGGTVVPVDAYGLWFRGLCGFSAFYSSTGLKPVDESLEEMADGDVKCGCFRGC